MVGMEIGVGKLYKARISVAFTYHLCYIFSMSRCGVKTVIRNELLYRFRYKCCRCGRRPSGYLGGGLDAHHYIAVTDGGSDDIENFVLLCHDCHKEWHKSWDCSPDYLAQMFAAFMASIPSAWSAEMQFVQQGAEKHPGAEPAEIRVLLEKFFNSFRVGWGLTEHRSREWLADDDWFSENPSAQWNPVNEPLPHELVDAAEVANQ